MRCEQGVCWAALPDWSWALFFIGVVLVAIGLAGWVISEWWKHR